MNKGMKKRWISLYVENQVGVLSKISGLFSAKSYNLDSLTVGTTEDPTVSRMTIARIIDATQGRRTKAVLITGEEFIILSALQPETISRRFNDGWETEKERGESENE